MARSSRERQAEYRRRHLADGSDVRLNVVVSAHAAAALKRLARHRGVTQRAVLESLFIEAERYEAERADEGYFAVTR